MRVRQCHVRAATVALAFFAGTTANAAEVFTLKSTTFEDGKILPKKVAGSKEILPSNPNCIGDNVSPQLSWSNVPDGTKSFAILMTDPEGRGGAGVIHFLAYGIPASVTGFAEGELSKLSDKYIAGKNIFGTGFFGGPCTPPNVMPHHYIFVLIATDLDPKELPPGLTKDELTAKIVPPAPAASHAKGVAGVVGLFVNPGTPK
jgi:Raf kinase inhibitor-like YbhB/YbcL family protein